MSNHRYFIIHKPFNMVSQFISPDQVSLLGDLDFDFPENTHAIGRLDNNSEGLLILTTNKKVTKLLFQGTTPHKRVYLVKIKNEITAENLEKLRNGVSFRISESQDYTTKPCKVEIVTPTESNFIEGFETRKQYPHTWLTITLTEGKFHQVRKMVAAINHKCQRLIRISIEGLELDGLQPGFVREVDEKLFFEKLKIDNWE